MRSASAWRRFLAPRRTVHRRFRRIGRLLRLRNAARRRARGLSVAAGPATPVSHGSRDGLRPPAVTRQVDGERHPGGSRRAGKKSVVAAALSSYRLRTGIMNDTDKWRKANERERKEERTGDATKRFGLVTNITVSLRSGDVRPVRCCNLRSSCLLLCRSRFLYLL